MKVALAAFLLLTGIAFAAPSLYANEIDCENAGYFWCEKCGPGNNVYTQMNQYAADKCVSSSLDCSYSCSTQCGAKCATNVNCPLNLTDDTCSFNGRCSACVCSYNITACPQTGTVSNGICYYGKRLCQTNGCSLSTCQLAEGQICEPDNGCTSPGEYISDYRCSGNDLFAKQIVYSCNQTQCLYNKTEILVEKCTNGCTNGACREKLCNVQGVLKDCNIYDGIYGGNFCVGNDIYSTYRDYTCVTNECTFSEKHVKQSTCKECGNGRCVDSGVTVITNFTQPTSSQNTPPKSNTGPLVATHPGSRLFNGLFFGSNSIALNVRGSGYVNFTVQNTNKLGMLQLQTNKGTLFSTNQAGKYSVPFNNATWLTITTSGSGWVFFTPATYDVRNVVAVYK